MHYCYGASQLVHVHGHMVVHNYKEVRRARISGKGPELAS